MKPFPLIFLFFPSRRRHTRCYRDWSSDVCSSDLPLGDGDEYRSTGGKELRGRDLRFEKGLPVVLRHTEDLAGGSHFRPEDRIDLREHVERENRFLDTEVRDRAADEGKVAQVLPQHHLGRESRHREVSA